MIARRILVRGRVQGVFYRNWTVQAARGLGLTGWVRNRRNGEAEILAIGPGRQVEALIEACRNGPPHASVAEVDATEAEPEPLAGFEKRPTA
jgi:acylphosphatase